MLLRLGEFLGLTGHIIRHFFVDGSILFLWFIIYSFIGWFYESTICSQVKYHRFINRGYLKGPLCPIYGAGAVVNYLLIGWIGNAPGIFLAAMFTSGVVEYFTSYAMERLFHQKWWDYTRYRFNLKGRICLYGCVIFGMANVIILRVIHPVLKYYTMQIPDAALSKIVIVLYVLFLVDVIYTTLHMETVNEKVRRMNQNLHIRKEYYRICFENVKDTATTKARALITPSGNMTILIHQMKRRMNSEDWSIRQLLPRMKESGYSLIEKLKEKLGL